MSSRVSAAGASASPIALLPKAELHLHMEGAIAPATVVALAARYGDAITEREVTARYAMRDFAAFIEAYKWVTSYLRAPADYALVARSMAGELLAHNVVYAEVVILSVGVMLLRKQDVAANFRAICEVAEVFEPDGLRLHWIFDAVRQFGPVPALEVVRRAAEMREVGVVAFGIGGDELALPASEFRGVYEFAAKNGLRRLMHAGEIGGPESVRDAINLLGVERIGQGLAAARDPDLMRLLAERSLPLEICPTSNICTGALARQLRLASPGFPDHPLPLLLRSGVPIAISTDDPAMFGTDLDREYATLVEMGLSSLEIVRVAETAFSAAFLPAADKAVLLRQFRERAKSLGLL